MTVGLARFQRVTPRLVSVRHALSQPTQTSIASSFGKTSSIKGKRYSHRQNVFSSILIHPYWPLHSWFQGVHQRSSVHYLLPSLSRILIFASNRITPAWSSHSSIEWCNFGQWSSTVREGWPTSSVYGTGNSRWQLANSLVIVARLPGCPFFRKQALQQGAWSFSALHPFFNKRWSIYCCGRFPQRHHSWKQVSGFYKESDDLPRLDRTIRQKWLKFEVLIPPRIRHHLQSYLIVINTVHNDFRVPATSVWTFGQTGPHSLLWTARFLHVSTTTSHGVSIRTHVYCCPVRSSPWFFQTPHSCVWSILKWPTLHSP